MTEPDDAPADAERASEPGREAVAEQRQVRVRRAPRYRAFGITGLGVGVVLALLLDVLSGDAAAKPQTSFGPASALVYLLLGLGLLGLLLGLGAALLVERRRR